MRYRYSLAFQLGMGDAYKCGMKLKMLPSVFGPQFDGEPTVYLHYAAQKTGVKGRETLIPDCFVQSVVPFNRWVAIGYSIDRMHALPDGIITLVAAVKFLMQQP